jgi:hypothetical protein
VDHKQKQKRGRPASEDKKMQKKEKKEEEEEERRQKRAAWQRRIVVNKELDSLLQRASNLRRRSTEGNTIIAEERPSVRSCSRSWPDCRSQSKTGPFNRKPTRHHTSP